MNHIIFWVIGMWMKKFNFYVMVGVMVSHVSSLTLAVLNVTGHQSTSSS